MTHPNDAYYQSCVGQWRCPMDFRVTDWPTFWRASMGPIDRIRVLSLVLWPSWLGRIYLDTSVSRVPGANGDGVLHTTRVSWLGICVMRSTERIELDPDGRRFMLIGTRRMMPTYWREESFSAPGVVDQTASKASYTFSWFGTELTQTTVASPDLVVATQGTAWSIGVQQLRRVV
ncbi:MAG: hypothetical protein KC502_22440 [Myxococcales bacterium]|nr:hypothetical protein [Myxococcales bacterium]